MAWMSAFDLSCPLPMGLLGGDREKAEVFMLAVDGLHTATPTAKVLKKRLGILIDQFS
jgi:hypothetical protein